MRNVRVVAVVDSLKRKFCLIGLALHVSHSAILRTDLHRNERQQTAHECMLFLSSSLVKIVARLSRLKVKVRSGAVGSAQELYAQLCIKLVKWRQEVICIYTGCQTFLLFLLPTSFPSCADVYAAKADQAAAHPEGWSMLSFCPVEIISVKRNVARMIG